MKFAFAIVASILASTLAASVPNTAKSMAAVRQDISKLSKQITIIDKLIDGFPANGANGAAVSVPRPEFIIYTYVKSIIY